MIQRIPQFLLPQTGQTTVYRTGDDGTFQAGRKRTNRFLDNGNGTVFDRATGLTWVKQPELIIPGAVGVHTTNQIQVAHGSWATGHPYALADLVADADGSQSAALTIASITNATLGVATVTAGHNLSSGQTIIITGCTGSASWVAMNGTARTVTVIDATTFSFGVNTTAYGTYDANSGTGKEVKYYVCSTAHTSGTFADDIAAAKWRLTVWTVSAANLTTPATMTWANAIDACLALEYAGRADWRLPNLQELLSVWDYSKGFSKWFSPLVLKAFYSYWSGTTDANTTTSALTWYVSGGASIGHRAKTLDSGVLPVRGGRTL